MFYRVFSALFLLVLFHVLPLQAQDLTPEQRFKATEGEVNKLIDEYHFREAYDKALTILPQTLPPFDRSTIRATSSSCLDYTAYAKSYAQAAQAANMAGEWEKGLDLAKQAKEVASISLRETEASYKQPADILTKQSDEAAEWLTKNATRIQELKAKKDATNAELNELDNIMDVERGKANVDRDLKFYKTYLDVAKYYAPRFDSLIEHLEQKLKAEADQIEAYKYAKGDRVKWAEAVANPTYLSAFPEQKDKIAFVHRLIVIAPKSAKVRKTLDAFLGKGSFTPGPKPGKRKG
jgi:hypothetical protein